MRPQTADSGFNNEIADESVARKFVRRSLMSRRVVVTGIGCVCPVGNSVAASWDALLKGRSGTGRTSLFDASCFPSRIAAEVKNFDQDFPEIRARYRKAGRNVY